MHLVDDRQSAWQEARLPSNLCDAINPSTEACGVTLACQHHHPRCQPTLRGSVLSFAHGAVGSA